MSMQQAIWVGAMVLASTHCWALEQDASGGRAGQAPVATEDPAARSAAQQVALSYLQAVNAKGLDGGIAYLHPDELARFKALLMPILEQERKAGRRNLLNATFGRSVEMTEVRLAAPEEFVRRFSRVAAARLGEAPARFDRVEVVGSVSEGEVLHVLLRTSVDQGSNKTQRLAVVSARRSGGDWKVLLGGEVEAMVASLRGGPAGRDAMDRRAEPTPEAGPLESQGVEPPPPARPPR